MFLVKSFYKRAKPNGSALRFPRWFLPTQFITKVRLSASFSCGWCLRPARHDLLLVILPDKDGVLQKNPAPT